MTQPSLSLTGLKTSVALCTFNGAGFLSAQLASIAAGSTIPDELIVCDDRSTDDTVRQLERFAATSGIPVHIYVNDERLGSTRNFEKAIGLCRNDIVFLSDQDDVWYPNRVERSLIAFEDPAVGGVFADADLVDERLQPLGKRMFEYLGVRHFVDRNHADLFGRLLFKPFVTGATMAFRRELVEQVRPYPASRFFIHDGWLALIIAGVAHLRVIDQPLIQYRQHASQQVGTMLSGIQQQPATAKAPIRYPLTRHEFADFYEELRSLLSAMPLRAAARQHFDRATNHNRQRLAMKRRKLTRPIAIARELLAGNYHHYSTGFISAAKDLISPP